MLRPLPPAGLRQSYSPGTKIAVAASLPFADYDRAGIVPPAVVAIMAVITCLDVALPAVRRLELALDDKIGSVWPARFSAVLARILGVEGELVIVTGFAGRDISCVKSHEAGVPSHKLRCRDSRASPQAVLLSCGASSFPWSS
jgi:hypothetical protein